MPGTFSKSARPARPGPYFNWLPEQVVSSPPAVGSIVAVPFTHDWGPFKTATLVQSWSEFLAKFGSTVGTPAYNAVWQAFQGEGGFEGRYGAGAVLCYRMGAAAAAKATKTINNTAAAAAITLTALYEGTFGNGLRVTTQDHAGDSTRNDLLILNGTQLLETFVYTDTDITGLAALINTQSKWVRASGVTSGTALTAASAAAFTGGNDGSTPLAADWTAMQSALEVERFGIFAPYGLIDTSIIAALFTWAGGASSGTIGRNAKGQRFEVVLGGAANEVVGDAITRAGTLNDGNFITLGVSSFLDSNLLDAAGNPVTLTSSQFAPRVAGTLANRGETMSLTNARYPGVTLINGIADDNVTLAFQGGVLAFTRDSDPEAPVHIEKGITTFTKGAPGTTNADPNFPYIIFRNPKFMRTMQNAEDEWGSWANREIIGKLQVNSKTRDEAISEMQTRLKARASVGIIQPEWTVAVDDNPPPTDQDEFIALKVGIKFGRSVEQVFFTVTAG